MRIIEVEWQSEGLRKRMVPKELLEPNKYELKIFRVQDSKVVSTETVHLTTKDGKTFENERGEEFLSDRDYHNNVFLYGKEVDDFLSIDKQKIFAVAYSALQQVDKNQQALQKKVTQLEATIESLIKRLESSWLLT